MAVDAIALRYSTYLPAVRYYLANLGTTMESQVTSSVSFVSSTPHFASCLPLYSLSLQSRELPLDLSLFPCVLLCAAPPVNPWRVCFSVHTVPFRVLLGP